MAGALGAPAQRGDLSAFRSASYRSIDKLADLPEPLARRIAALVQQPIAESGAAWNATDVIVPSTENLPVRRFVIAAVSKSRALVVYEHGGIARHQHLLAFDLRGSDPRLVANVSIERPDNVDDLLHRLAKPLVVSDHF